MQSISTDLLRQCSPLAFRGWRKRYFSTRWLYRSNQSGLICWISHSGARVARSSRAARTVSPTHSRLESERTRANTWVESVRCLPPAFSQPRSLQTSRSRSSNSVSCWLSTKRARNSDKTEKSKPAFVSSKPKAYFQSMRSRTALAACRSVRPSAYWSTRIARLRRLAGPQSDTERQSAHLDIIHPTHHASVLPGFPLDRPLVPRGLFLLECFPVLSHTVTSTSSLRWCSSPLFPSIFPLQYFFHSPTKS